MGFPVTWEILSPSLTEYSLLTRIIPPELARLTVYEGWILLNHYLPIFARGCGDKVSRVATDRRCR